jgi:hypothetical protein
MENILVKLEGLESDLDHNEHSNNNEVLIKTNTMLRLYLTKLNKNNQYYDDILKKIDLAPASSSEYKSSLWTFKSAISALIEDVKQDISGSSKDLDRYKTEEVKLLQAEIETSRLKIEEELRAVTTARNEIERQRNALVEQQGKFDEFIARQEVISKLIDFGSSAQHNVRIARRWMWLVVLGILTFIIILYFSLENTSTFIKIAKDLDRELITMQKTNVSTSTVLYFSFFKYIFTKLFLYGMCLYLIAFFIRNYKAQMHNNVINGHKANALKSTYSILDITKSEEGNDKILVQATNAIFSHQNSGYESKEPETSPNLFTNIVDTASKKL